MNLRIKKIIFFILLYAVGGISLLAIGENASMFMPSEQFGILSNIFSQYIKSSTTNSIPEGELKYFQRDLRDKYSLISTPYERSLLSERIGNQGRARYAAEQGWIKTLGSQHRGIRQGPDAIYWDNQKGVLRVLETKGQYSQAKESYGSKQGTNSNTIFSAERVIRDTKTSIKEKTACAQVIIAAKNNRLQTGIIRTTHDFGKPNSPYLEKEWATANISKQADVIERRLLAERPELTSVFRRAKFDFNMNKVKYFTEKPLPVIGLAGSLFLFLDSYKQFKEALITFNDPLLQNTALPYMKTSLGIGKTSEALALSISSIKTMRVLGDSKILMNAGRLAGKLFLPLAAGVESLNFGVAYYEYSSGRINRIAFYRRTTGPAIFVICTGTGAVIGFCAGGGVGAFPGAGIGATVSIPLTYLGDFAWNWFYRDSDIRQMETVFSALENQYGK